MEFRDQQTQNDRVATLMELMNDERIISKKEREILSLRFGLDKTAGAHVEHCSGLELWLSGAVPTLDWRCFLNRGKKMSRPFGRSAESVL